MKDTSYWRRYVIEANPREVEQRLAVTGFASDGEKLELVCFEAGSRAPCILISPGIAGHAYVFAELGYRMHERGYNVFILPKHGGRTVSALMRRHADALRFIAAEYNDRIGIYSEGFGGYVSFYLALARGPLRSIICQNAPAILNESAFHEAAFAGSGSARRRRPLARLSKLLVKIVPGLKLPIVSFFDFRELVDPREDVERSLVEAYLHDPDFDRSYPLRAVMSLLDTPPPRPLKGLELPTMFLVPRRGVYPDYIRDLFARLPPIPKRMVEVDGSVFWMCSHPRQAAALVCDWFDETLEPAASERSVSGVTASI